MCGTFDTVYFDPDYIRVALKRVVDGGVPVNTNIIEIAHGGLFVL